MRLRRRRTPGGPADDIAAFWDWWTAEGRSAAEAALGSGHPESLVPLLGPRVHELGDLAWELAPGEDSTHVLVIGAEGDPAQRALARRVVLAAPEPDDTWSYVDSRPPAADPESVVIDLEGHRVDLARVRVSARVNEGRFDVQVHHPSFPELGEPARARAGLLALDAALGEVDTELWLGEIVAVELEPLDGFGLAALRAVVGDLKRQRLDSDGQPSWVMLSGETSEGPLLAMVQSPLHPVMAAQLDTYVAVTVPYRHRTQAGLPGEASLESLRALEHRLSARLGNDGRVVAHLSTGGVRTLHLYVDSTTGALSTVKEVSRGWDEGSTSVHELHDPAWQAVAHLRR